MNHGKWICQNKRFIEQQLDYFFHLLASVFYLLYTRQRVDASMTFDF